MQKTTQWQTTHLKDNSFDRPWVFTQGKFCYTLFTSFQVAFVVCFPTPYCTGWVLFPQEIQVAFPDESQQWQCCPTQIYGNCVVVKEQLQNFAKTFLCCNGSFKKVHVCHKTGSCFLSSLKGLDAEAKERGEKDTYCQNSVILRSQSCAWHTHSCCFEMVEKTNRLKTSWGSEATQVPVWCKITHQILKYPFWCIFTNLSPKTMP